MFWDLLKIVFVTGVFLGLLRLHDRLRSLERKVEDIEGAAGKNGAEDESVSYTHLRAHET